MPSGKCICLRANAHILACQVTCLTLMQDTLDNSPDPQSTIDFFNGLADGTDTAAGASSEFRQHCMRQQHANQVACWSCTAYLMQLTLVHVTCTSQYEADVKSMS